MASELKERAKLVELTREGVVDAIVRYLMQERDAVQRYLDATPPGQLRAGYSLGMRDALDQAVDDVVSRRWSSLVRGSDNEP